MSISAQNTAAFKNTSVVLQSHTMHGHGTGRTHPMLKISAAAALLLVLASALAFTFAVPGSQPSAHPSAAGNKALASTHLSDSQKARAASYKLSKPLGSLFVDAMGSAVASSN